MLGVHALVHDVVVHDRYDMLLYKYVTCTTALESILRALALPIHLVSFQSSLAGFTTGAATSSLGTAGGSTTITSPRHRQLQAHGIGLGGSASVGTYSSSGGARGVYDEETATTATTTHTSAAVETNDEIVISAAMQQLRDPGVLIVAHGSRGKPKTVRLQLTESAITWRTETRKKGPKSLEKPKMGKLHQVPLSHIMYVDVGKQTTALRRVENASVPDALCFSLLTKEGSLDLEANSARERDALVSCFSLVLDEVHAQNWRDIYRGPSSDMPSSFDDYDGEVANAGAGNV